MGQNTPEAGYYFNNRQAVGARLDYTLEWYEELGTNLMEPSTDRTAENIADLRAYRDVAQRDMGILAARLSEFSDDDTASAELDEILTSELEEVK